MHRNPEKSDKILPSSIFRIFLQTHLTSFLASLSLLENSNSNSQHLIGFLTYDTLPGYNVPVNIPPIRI